MRYWFVSLLLLLITAASVLYLNRYVIDDSLKFRQLANGWISIYPQILTRPNLSAVEKFESIVEADIVHGRFRPIYFYYASIPYLISPIVHGNYLSESGRPWYLLMNGDLQLFSKMLLGTIVLTIFAFGALIYRFTSVAIFSLIPILFIPLATATAENLLQNYIDSQEIPLMLFISVWFFSICMYPLSRDAITKSVFLTLGLCSLIAAFLTKETTLIMLPTIVAMFLSGYFCRRLYSSGNVVVKSRSLLLPLGLSSLVAVIFTGLVIFVVMLNKQGYASGYDFNLHEFNNSLRGLFECLSLATIHTWFYGYFPIISAFVVLFIKRHSQVAGIKTTWHCILFVGLFFSFLGYLFVLIPWKPLLAKYCYPSVVLFTCLVAYSLSIIATYLKEIDKRLFNIFMLFSLVSYAFFFQKVYAKADKENKYWFEFANYGIKAVPLLVKEIADSLENADKEILYIYLDLSGNRDRKLEINWVANQMMRSLNIDYGYNIVEHDLKPIVNVSMPKGELSSLTYRAAKKKVFLSQEPNDLSSVKFDIVFRSCIANQSFCENSFVTNVGKYIRRDNPVKYLGYNGYHPIVPKLDEFDVIKYELY